MLKEIAFTLWFFLPAGIANAMPIFAAHLPGLKGWNAPMDFGKSFRGRRLLGEHKTWRGVVSGMIVSTIVFGLQQLIVRHAAWAQTLTSEVSYAHLPTIIVGPLFGIGALGGDALKSFCKRQLGVQPGRSWFPFDQIDYIVGGALAVLPYVRLRAAEYAWLVVLWLAAHLLVSYAGFLVGLKERPI